MMKRAILAVSLVGILGCATMLWWESPSNVTSTTLNLGMSKQQAQALLGPPQSVVTQQLQEIMVETWKYMDKTLTFHNGVLSSWGGVNPSDAAWHAPNTQGTP